MTKTIGYVLSEFPVLSESFVGTEMRAMRACGHTVVPLVLRRTAGRGQPQDAPLAQAARHVDKVAPGAALAALAGSLRNLRRWLPFLLAQRDQPRRSLLWAAARVAALARAGGCRHLHAHFAQASAATAIVAARMAGLGVSFVGHGYDVYAAPADLPLKLDSADVAVAVCRDMEDDFRRLAPRARIVTVPCGIEPDRLVPPAARMPSDGLRILFVGRLVDSKGLDDLLAAMATARWRERFLLTVVGDGPLRAELGTLADELGLADRVTFAGAVPTAWFAGRAGAFDVLVAPFREGRNGTRDTGPVVLKEAMALGLPVIGTRFMGIKEIVDESCGRLVPPGDRVGLAQALDELAAMSPDRRSAMGAAGRRRVLELFTSAASAKRLSLAIEAVA